MLSHVVTWCCCHMFSHADAIQTCNRYNSCNLHNSKYTFFTQCCTYFPQVENHVKIYSVVYFPWLTLTILCFHPAPERMHPKSESQRSILVTGKPWKMQQKLLQKYKLQHKEIPNFSTRKRTTNFKKCVTEGSEVST